MKTTIPCKIKNLRELRIPSGLSPLSSLSTTGKRPLLSERSGTSLQTKARMAYDTLLAKTTGTLDVGERQLGQLHSKEHPSFQNMNSAECEKKSEQPTRYRGILHKCNYSENNQCRRYARGSSSIVQSSPTPFSTPRA
jgi:hypothetical protein